jgi:hypothetical protein
MYEFARADEVIEWRVFAAAHESEIGTNAKCRNVRFRAAVGVIADLYLKYLTMSNT